MNLPNWLKPNEAYPAPVNFALRKLLVPVAHSAVSAAVTLVGYAVGYPVLAAAAAAGLYLIREGYQWYTEGDLDVAATIAPIATAVILGNVLS